MMPDRAILDFSSVSRHEQDNDTGDCYKSGDDYSPEKGAGRRSASFNAHCHCGGGGRPMAPDADGCAEVDPVVEPLCGIGARQRQANATVRGGMSRDLLESVNKIFSWTCTLHGIGAFW